MNDKNIKGRNKMSAGELLRKARLDRGWNQIKMAEVLRINKTSLNQLEKGQRLLTYRFFSIIKDSNLLKEYELRALREQAAIDLAQEKFQVDLIVAPNQKTLKESRFFMNEFRNTPFDIRTLPEFLDNITQQLDKNEQVINAGNPSYVTEWLEEDILPLLWKKTLETKNKTPVQSWLIQECLSRAIAQYADTFVYWKSRKDAANMLRQCASDLEVLDIFSNNPIPRLLKYYCLSYADYFEEKDKSSVNYAVLGLMAAENDKIKDQEILRSYFELLAFGSARLGDERKAGKAVAKIRDLIELPEVSSKEAQGSMNTVARVESEIGSDDFYRIHEETKAAIEKNRKGFEEPFNILINIWTELEAMRKLKSIDRGQLESLLDKAAMFSENQFYRIKTDIRKEAKLIYSLLDKGGKIQFIHDIVE